MDSGSRFLSTIAPSGEVDAGDELNEDEILWTDDNFNAGQQLHPPPTKQQHRRSVSFHHTNTGILAALPEINSRIPVLYRKPSISSPVKAVPRERDNSGDYLSTQSMPARKLRQSAPMKVPIMSIAISKQRNSRLKEEYEYSNGGGAGDDEMMMLPPHEIVARGCLQSSGSMMEGAGRTLKGRDLRQVRNAVFRQTGFLD
ncbi:hypothetical protein LINPERPRIM_LOCUS16353 [Linum perenne]